MDTRTHIVCVPYPLQGHINAMLHLSKAILAATNNTLITFVHSERNFTKLTTSVQSDRLRFASCHDGTDPTIVPDHVAFMHAVRNTWAGPFKELVEKLGNVRCIITDMLMNFGVSVAKEMGIPGVVFCSFSACGYMAALHVKELVDRGIVPLKSESDLTNGYLETPVDWIPGISKSMKLKHINTIIQTTDSKSPFLDFLISEMQDTFNADAIILNTFHDLERHVIDAMSTILPPVYPVGPLNLPSGQIRDASLKSISSSLRKHDFSCLKWLENKKPRSVMYVNFGSLIVLTMDQLTEFAWGLAESGYDFILVIGDNTNLPEELANEIRDRGFIANWCPQEEVLENAAVGGFLTHCGWNSMMESVTAGVPMICWPVFADQHASSLYACEEWGIGVEMGKEVKRREVKEMVEEIMEGEKGKEMRMRSAEWKQRAMRACEVGGKSFDCLERVIQKVLYGSPPV